MFAVPVLPQPSNHFFTDADENDNYGCFVAAPTLHTSSSAPSLHSSSSLDKARATSTSLPPPLPVLSRRELSSNLDDSRHFLKDNKYVLALEMATSVIHNITMKNNLPVPFSSTTTTTTSTTTSADEDQDDDDSDALEAMDSEDLLLMAKALFQKGKIHESYHRPGASGDEADQDCLAAFTAVGTTRIVNIYLLPLDVMCVVGVIICCVIIIILLTG